MSPVKKLTKSNKLRWTFFAIATAAVLAITGMNVYSLYALRQSTIDSAKDVKKSQLNEFTSQVTYRFYTPFFGISKLDMEHMERVWNKSGKFPKGLTDVLNDAINDPIFTDIHFVPRDEDICIDPEVPAYKFDSTMGRFQTTNSVPDKLCDGLGLAKSRVAVILDDYQFNNSVSFDSHRSFTLALFNRSEQNVIGYLNFTINQDYLLNEYLIPELKTQFGPSDQSGIVVWLLDWVQREAIASSDENYNYDRDKYPIDIRQRFGNSLNEWTLHAMFLDSPTVAASNASLQRNLFVLIVAVIVLFGALLFIFVNAQRERDLANRQAGFLANITHELKTPLTVMQAAGENIADGRVTDGERLRNYGDHIYQESVRLRKMIEKLLDAAKVDSGQAVAEQTPMKLNELAEEFYIANKTYIEKQGFEFTLETEENMPLAMIDPDHIETILNNLVENAMKYSSDQKKIKLQTYTDNKDVILSVEDKGDGIPKKSLGYIFDKFYRVENSLTAKTKGHGLGLAIVKNMVELNGGKVEVKSKMGAGSTFTIRFAKFLKSETSDSPSAKTNGKGQKTDNPVTEIDQYV